MNFIYLKKPDIQNLRKSVQQKENTTEKKSEINYHYEITLRDNFTNIYTMYIVKWILQVNFTKQQSNSVT